MKRFLSLTYGVYALSAILLLCGMLSLIACHQTISAQLSQGVPLQGNELAILNLYLQSCTQYIALAVLLYLGGRTMKDEEITHILLEEPVENDASADMREHDSTESDDGDDTDDDWIPEGYTEGS